MGMGEKKERRQGRKAKSRIERERYRERVD